MFVHFLELYPCSIADVSSPCTGKTERPSGGLLIPGTSSVAHLHDDVKDPALTLSDSSSGSQTA